MELNIPLLSKSGTQPLACVFSPEEAKLRAKDVTVPVPVPGTAEYLQVSAFLLEPFQVTSGRQV